MTASSSSSKDTDVGATPLFFGDARRQLYGAYDQPAAGTAGRDTAVVLAYPAFPEYNKAHWLFRRLAQRIAQEGFFVLRFDYSATGDSAGPSEAGTLDQWVDDVVVAAEEARDLSGARDISIVGLRLGATVAAQAVDAGLCVRGLVLWDPVVVGDHYMDHLLARARIHRRIRRQQPRRQAETLLGYPFPDDVKRAIEEVDLRKLKLNRSQRIELISTDNEDHLPSLSAALERDGVPTELTRVRLAQTNVGGQENVRMSTEPLDAVIAALHRTEAT